MSDFTEGQSSSSGTRSTLAIVVLIALALCLCLALLTLCALLGMRILDNWQTGGDGTPLSFVTATARVTPTAVPPTSTPSAGTPTATQEAAPQSTPTPTPLALSTPEPGSSAFETEVRLLAAEVPQRDLRTLAERLTDHGAIPEIVRTDPLLYQVGDEAEFWVGNQDTYEQFQITAVLQYVTPHLYMWVQEGLFFDQAALARSAETFEKHIYPTTRALFGSEWSPGVDSDPHLYVLNSSSREMGRSVAGYYSSADEYSRLANPYSNEHEMFYVSMDGGMRPGSAFYDGVLMHEFQHMIHWFRDRNEESWVNEGCSELAVFVGGYDPGGFDRVFLSDPDVQLTTWPEIYDASPHYGGSYLFMLYLYGRFGPDLIREIVAQPENGIQGVDAALAAYDVGFEEVYGDWLIANYVDSLRLDTDRPGDGAIEPRYSYPDQVVGPLGVDHRHSQYPVQRDSNVSQYGADYVELEVTGDLALEFAGESEARLLPVDAYSGRYAWWSNRGDVSDMTLTRAFDLRALERGAQSATLQVQMWYDIEEGWDYAYVEVSADGGATWEILAGPSSTTDNPNGNSFGTAYTGSSGGWIQESFDLSAYAGEQVLIRFEYVTDDAVNRAGWLIDDVCILETGFCDDMESGVGDWQARGFVYSDNRVGQRYLVQVVVLGEQGADGGGPLRVLQMPLDATQRGQLKLRGLDRESRAVLVVSALAPATTEVARYEYSIKRLP